MSVSGFLYRDILKYILPVGLFYILFYPLTGFNLNDVGSVIPAVIILSFILGPLIERISSFPFLIFSDVKRIRRTCTWMRKNWNIRRLFYNLNNQDRDYLFLTESYIIFYYNSGFVILMYFSVILYSIITDSIFQYQTFFIHKTPVINNMAVSSWILFILCILVFLRLKGLVVREMGYLMCPNGEYEHFGEKLQKEKQQLFAYRIYGRVYKNTDKKYSESSHKRFYCIIYNFFCEGNSLSPASNIKVNISCSNSTQTVLTNDDGQWSIDIDENMLDELVTINFPDHNDLTATKRINLNTYKKPYIETII